MDGSWSPQSQSPCGSRGGLQGSYSGNLSGWRQPSLKAIAESWSSFPGSPWAQHDYGSFKQDIGHLEQVVFRVLIRVVCGSNNVKGWPSRQHLVQQHSKGPPVHGETDWFQLCWIFWRIYFIPVILCPQNLRSNIVGSSTESGGGVTRSDSLFTHPIVCQLDVTLMVQQHVVQLQVPVDNPPLVQVVQGQADFRAVEPGRSK